MTIWSIILALAALMIGAAAGWLAGRAEAARARAERDAGQADFHRAIADLASASERARAADELAAALDQARDEREEARTRVATLAAEARAFDARLAEQQRHQAEAREAMFAQFRELAGSALGEAQAKFLERAEARFRQSEDVAGERLSALLAPVSERLGVYEQAVEAVERDRRSAFDQLRGELEQLRHGQERVSTEAARLVNSLRNAPKARGRWGEQQLRNVLEICGLAEHADFETEVSVAGEDGRLRPDAIIRIPGGRSLIVDAKVSLNAYQDAFDSGDEAGRIAGLAAHARSMRDHVRTLGDKAYQHQFGDAVDFVVMFVPGEHFVSAALEQEPGLWDDAFARKVLIATPTNLVAIARTIASVWRQEKLAREAVEIGRLGKELHDRLATAAEHLRVMGGGLNTAVVNYNKFVGSFETNLMSTGRKFAALNIEAPTKSLPDVTPLEVVPRYADPPPLIEGEAEG